MNLELKKIYSIDYDLNNFPLDKIDNFFMVVTMSIGFINEDGADDFTVYIYTTKWLQENIFSPQLGKNSIIINKFDLHELIVLINSVLELCNSENDELAFYNLSKYFLWEFDGYKD
ncbi:Imm8 family immunity protein [Neisseria yangbaofengii]|uniref:Imm8 family immunity protein n=1 Tax=Neisseria yangbaofengii TaxID=2709396 RepID=UPI0013EC16F9|nr:Imm8 family immunity protein [Neisseria yangbaofengii]